MRKTLFILIALISINFSAQQIHITGTVVESDSEQKLEFATIIFAPTDGSQVTGGTTDGNGEFDIVIKSGTYNITIEFLSFESQTIQNKELTDDIVLGIIALKESAESLEEIEIIAEKSTVEFRLDKKIYNIGKDMTVKGGSASDVLDNIPSVTVDVEGNIALRGNENVRILINGKPSSLVGLSPGDALRQFPADAIEKVEIITSPSARYEAEGTAGIINIVIRKGKALGFNGTTNLSLGTPTNYGASANLNYKTNKFNYFTTIGYGYNDAPGNAYFENEYFNTIGDPIEIEDRIYDRERKNFNIMLGTEYFISDKASILGSFYYRSSDRNTNTSIETSSRDIDNIEQKFSVRNEFEERDDKRYEYNLNYTQTFNSDDHKLTADFQYQKSNNDEYSIITGQELFPGTERDSIEETITLDDRSRILIQADYVLPIGENAQFEAGYRSNINESTTDYTLLEEQPDGSLEINPLVSNIFIYDEKIHALYVQYGNKFGKLSTLFGLRMETALTDISVTGENLDTKKEYTEFFPTVNLSYEFNDMESLTLGYNRRIRRPRSWFINPFPSRASESNIFVGNPDLDPSFSNGVDLGYLKRWNKVTFNTSVYYNYATDVFQFVSSDTGDTTPGGVPITKRSPINIASEQRFGWEFSVNYTAFRWWRLNTSLNFFKTSRNGNGVVPDSDDSSWNARLNSRVNLPAGIDWQTTFSYRAPQENFQSKTEARFGINLAFSKDVLKENATLTLNVSDLLNSRKRKSETFIEDFSYSYSEFQWRERQIRLTFTYRLNQKKRRQRQNGGGNFDDGGGEGGF